MQTLICIQIQIQIQIQISLLAYIERTKFTNTLQISGCRIVNPRVLNISEARKIPITKYTTTTQDRHVKWLRPENLMKFMFIIVITVDPE